MNKLKENINTVEFLRVVATCRGEVFFETVEGDVLNLKSMLTMYLFAAVAEKKEIISTGTVRCEEPGDYQILSDYLKESPRS